MKIVDEFMEFIDKGDVMDMAVGIIIGGAFTGIVTALTDDVINPIITVVTGGNGTDVGGLVIPGTSIDFGKFISACLNFLIIAFVVFALVKGVNKMRQAAALAAAKAAEAAAKAAEALPVDLPTGEEEEEEAPAPTCPFCLEEHKEGATVCPHCGRDLPSTEEDAEEPQDEADETDDQSDADAEE